MNWNFFNGLIKYTQRVVVWNQLSQIGQNTFIFKQFSSGLQIFISVQNESSTVDLYRVVDMQRLN